MAKIALRLYNHEIENLIEQSQVEEAAAHCIHILKTFPKHIATYRLLGKAFLERQRYGEAADIFQRVLAAMPDDFITNVGMSIIREDEGNLDAAIWHMERAFEVQPSNAAVQDELRRLYGQRDGIEPPKVRLTRGALVRMYVRGNLYQQAIAEIRAALGEEPQRPDLRALLARMLFLSGQKVEAAELCSEVLARYPYNFEANRTLAEILPGTSRSDDAQAYRQRINSLDPYGAFTSPDLPDPADVPDNAVMLERLDYSPSMPTSDDQPTWAASLGIDLIGEDQSRATPDWMTAAPGLTGQTGLEPGAETGELEATPGEIPDWMQAAGWGASTGAFDESKASAELSDESEAALVPGEIPAWLQAMAPDQSVEETGEPAESKEDMQAFESLFAGETAPAGETPVDETGQQPGDQLAGLPDWLQPEGGQPEQQPASTDSVPDWLKDLSPTGEETPQPTGEIDATGEPAAQEDVDTLAWLQELGGETAEEAAQTPESELPDWLREAQAGELPVDETASEQPLELTGAPLGTGDEEQPPAGEIPDWLRGEVPPADITGQLAGETPASEQPQSGWTPVDSGAGEAAAGLTAPDAEPQPTETGGATAISDEDAALAWLEGLAARHGADEDLLFVPPDQRTETPPEWVQRAAAEQQLSGEPAGDEQAQPETSEPAPSETGATGELPDWLAGENEAPAPDETTGSLEEQPLPSAEGLPDWLQAMQPDEISEQPEAGELPTEPLATGELPDWLQQAAESEQTPAEISTGEETPLETAALEDTGQLPAAETLPNEEDAAAKTQPVRIRPPQPVDETPQAVETPGEMDLAAMGEALGETGEEPAQPLADLPDWLRGETVDETPATDETSETPSAESASHPTLSDEDAALAWLEGLAARHGADENLLFVPPDQRTETPPDWVQEAVAQEQTNAETQPTPEEPVGELPAEETLGISEADLVQAAALEETAGEVSAEPTDIEPGAGEAQEQPVEQAAGEWQPEVTPAEQTPAGTVETPEALPDWLQDIVPGGDSGTAPAVEEEALSMPLPQEFSQQGVEETAEPLGDWSRAAASSTPAESGRMLLEAQAALDVSDVNGALDRYNQLIANGEHLDEVVHDLRDALYHHPVDAAIWQALGDAYLRGNQMQQALDAYTKAEELLR